MTGHKAKEYGSRNAFIAIGKSVVLDDKVEQVRSLFFHTRIDFLAIEGLINRPQRTSETLIFL